MFEVLWTDPDRELVGEHRQKKAKEREEQRRAEEKEETENPTHAARASESSSRRFFGSRTLGKAVAPLKSRPSSKASPLLTQTNTQGSTKRDSDASRPPSDTLGDSQKLPKRVPERYPRNEHFSFPSSRDSAVSKWTDKTVPTNLSPSAASFAAPAGASGAQTRGHSTLVTQGRDARARQRAPNTGTFRSIPGMSTQPDGAGDGGLGQPQTPDSEISEDEIDVPVDISPGPKSPLRSIPQDWASYFKPNNPKAWKTPSEWALATHEAGAGEKAARPSTTDSEEEDDVDPREADIRKMRDELKMMAGANEVDVIRKLRGSWSSLTGSNQYKEVENEKKKWMLSSLYNLDKAVRMTAMAPSLEEEGPRKVLALLESPSTATYLANTHTEELVYHLSPSPLSKEQFPNIRPVVVPEQTSSFPISGRTFVAAYSLSLPSIVPMDDIPDILNELSRCLLDGATFHLTLIDPLPVPSSMGPRMRDWFSAHLLKNIHKKGCGTAGSIIIPDWLTRCRLRGPGSVISRCKFLAIDAKDTPPPTDLEEAKREARGLLGPMLWKEVWGRHVEAESWWWEVDEIVEECNQLETFWEYSLIEAVNQVFE